MAERTRKRSPKGVVIGKNTFSGSIKALKVIEEILKKPSPAAQTAKPVERTKRLETQPPAISADCEIQSYLHCGLCIQELPHGVSPKHWSRTQAGWTEQGLQIWCNRHDCNVLHIDFQGQKHPANIGISEKDYKRLTTQKGH